MIQKPLNLQRVKTSEDALEMIRRARILNDTSALPLELFQKIDARSKAENLDVYHESIMYLLPDETYSIDHLKQENDQLLHIQQMNPNQFRAPEWSVSHYGQVTSVSVSSMEDARMYKKDEKGMWSKASDLYMRLIQNNGVFWSKTISGSGTETYYQFRPDEDTIEQWNITFGKKKGDAYEILKINGQSVADFLRDVPEEPEEE